jgi:patatin-like phospholipase/acyl hydrolase
MAIWRILSIDGGGTRGIIPAIILASMEERTGKPICQLFDLIAGTSTGAILALGLTKPNSSGEPEFTARDLCKLYEREIPNIFRNPQSWWGNLLTPKYRSFVFQQVLKTAFGECRLKSALTDVLIPCFDIDHRLPYMFNTRSAEQQAQYDFPMRDVALAASASPTLFYPVRIPRSEDGESMCLVDGGVFANNPAINALAEIKSVPSGKNDQCFMVSLGTGKSQRPLSDELLSLWGYVQWSRPMLDLVMDSISESVHEQMNHLLPASHDRHYYRLQVDLPQSIDPAIDNASSKNMRALSHAAQIFCSDRKSGQELSRVCETLLRLIEQN